MRQARVFQVNIHVTSNDKLCVEEGELLKEQSKFAEKAADGKAEPGRYMARTVRGPCDEETATATASKVVGVVTRGIPRTRRDGRLMPRFCYDKEVDGIR